MSEITGPHEGLAKMQIPGALLQSTESDFIKRLMNLNFEYSSQKIIMYTNG